MQQLFPLEAPEQHTERVCVVGVEAGQQGRFHLLMPAKCWLCRSYIRHAYQARGTAGVSKQLTGSQPSSQKAQEAYSHLRSSSLRPPSQADKLAPHMTKMS